jgi:hypothetical protein
MGNAQPQRKVKNEPLVGHGGEPYATGLHSGGRCVVLCVAFDYGQEALDNAGCGPLSCTPDASRFASLAKQCGAEVSFFCDNPDVPSLGFPDRDMIFSWIQQKAQELGPEDTFIWFYAGHGNGADDEDGDEADGQDEELCFVTQDGYYNPMKDDWIAQLIQSFDPETHILVVTDCCHSATVCDLENADMAGRPVVHLAAVKDEQCAQDLGDGGAFTSSLLETIETYVEEGNDAFSLTDIFNRTHDDFSDRFAEQDFCIELTPEYDPDTFMWPLIPPPGYQCATLLD